MVVWETDVDNSGGGASDEVIIKCETYMKGNAETAIKNQSLSDTTVIGTAARYKQYTSTFTIDYDDGSNPVEIGDTMAFHISFDRTNSDITDIVINRAIFRYKSKQIHLRV